MRLICAAYCFPLLVIACASTPSYDGANEATGPASSSPSSGGGVSSEDAGAGGQGSIGSSDDASTPPVTPPASGEDAGAPKPKSDGGSPHPGSDAGSPAASDASAGGPPARNAKCTPLSQQTGTAVDTTHGRLDGTLVYVLPIDGSSSCNGDSAHVHLQIEVSGSVYDVAVDVGKSGDEVGWYETSLAVPGGAWAEGWHGSDGLGYSSLGLTSSAFATLAPTDMGNELESLLASTSKISVFCTGYSPGDNGCHDVHYQDGTSQDGAIVLDPTSATSPVVFFRFTNQSF